MRLGGGMILHSSQYTAGYAARSSHRRVTDFRFTRIVEPRSACQVAVVDSGEGNLVIQ